MALGKVTVNNMNLDQGGFDEIERKTLFLGVSDTNIGAGTVIALNSQSDLDQLLGTAATQLKTQVASAQANGGENWQAWALPIAVDDDWGDALDLALHSVSPELVALCTPAVSAGELETTFAKVEAVRTD